MARKPYFWRAMDEERLEREKERLRKAAQKRRDVSNVRGGMSIEDCRALFALDSPRLPSPWPNDPKRKVYVESPGMIARSLLYRVIAPIKPLS